MRTQYTQDAARDVGAAVLHSAAAMRCGSALAVLAAKPRRAARCSEALGIPASVKRALFQRDPRPCKPTAEAVSQPLIWCL